MPNPYKIIPFILILISFHSHSQAIAKSSKSLKSNAILTEEFEYLIRKNDTIRNGKYHLELFLKRDTAEGEFSRSVSQLDLTYKNGELDGPVTSLQTNFKLSDANQRFKNYYLNTPVDGISYELQGNFKENKPLGEWKVSGRQIVGAKVLKDFKVLTVSFNSKGEYQRDFSYINESNKVKISGIFGKNNLIDGNWEYIQGKQKAVNIRFDFSEGLIVKLVYNNQDLFILDEISDSFEELELDSTFYQYLSIRLKKTGKDISSELKCVSDFIHALNRSVSYLNFSNLALGDAVPSIVNINAPVVRYPLFPFKDSEEKQIDHLRISANKTFNKIDSLMKSSVFSIYTINDSILTRNQTALKILRDHAKIILDFSINMDNPVSKYFNRDKYADFFKAQLNDTPLEEKYEFKGSNRTVAIDLGELKKDNNYIQELLNYLIAVDQSFNRIEMLVSARLAEVKISNELGELEDKMGKLASSLEDNLNQRLSTTFDSNLDEKFQNEFFSFKNKLLQTYAELEEDKKMKIGEDMVGCLEKLHDLVDLTQRIKQRRLIIHAAYNKKEMNPVTYTTMDVILYERLYNAYIEKLLPWAIMELGKSASYDCERFERKFNNILTIQQYMIDVLEDKPQKVNRKLRAKDTISDILRKLELQLL